MKLNNWNEYQALALETMRQDDLSLELEEQVLLQACFNITMSVSLLVREFKLIDTHEITPLHFTIMGLVGEAGELIDLIKKMVFHKQDISVPDLIDELGDVHWYLATTAAKAGYDMDAMRAVNDRVSTAMLSIWNALTAISNVYWIPVDDVLKYNIEKLHKERYPDGFEFGGGRDRN